MKQFIRFFSLLAGLLVLVALAIGIVTPDEVMAFIDSPDAVWAMAAGAAVTSNETVTTGEQASKSTILDNYLSQQITRMRPAETPLDTILRQLGTAEKINSWVTEFYTADVRGVKDDLRVAYDTSSDFTAGSATDEDPGKNILKVNNIHIWHKDDVGIIHGTTGQPISSLANNNEIAFHVIAVDRSNKELTVITPNGLNQAGDARGYRLASGSPGTIAVDTKISRIGSAKAELDAQTTPHTTFPFKDFNHAQIHMRQIEESVYARLHKKEIPWGWNDYRMQALFDMRREMEATSLFGVRGKMVDPETDAGDIKYFAGGINMFIPNSVSYDPTSGITNSDLINWSKQIFTGNAGSEQRVLFAGSDLIETLHDVDTINKQLEAQAVTVKYGINFSQVETKFGILLIKHHKLFDDHGWGEKGMVLDMNNIQRQVLKPMATRQLDLQKPGIRNANASVIDEAFCVVTRYPQTHMLINNDG